MTAQRPDLLPFTLPRRMGLPFHGLVTDRELKLPDATTMVYPWVANVYNGGTSSVWPGGEALPVAGPGAAVPVRTPAEEADDIANNYNWKPYAFLSGIERNIGGRSLGQHAWLYCDGQSTWKLRAEIVRPVYNDITIKIYLSSLFGRLGDDDVQVSSERLLASLPFVPKVYFGENGAEDLINGTTSYLIDYQPISVSLGQYADADLFVCPKIDGSEALISFGFEKTTNINGDYPESVTAHRVRMGNRAAEFAYRSNTVWTVPAQARSAIANIPYNTELRGVFKVAVSGTGSLLPGAVGQGISASLVLYKDIEDLHVVTWTPIDDITSACWTTTPAGYRGPFDPASYCDLDPFADMTTTEIVHFLYCYDKDNNEIHATLTHVLTYRHTDYRVGPPCGRSCVFSTEAEYSYDLTYAGKRVTWAWTGTGYSQSVPGGSPACLYFPENWSCAGKADTSYFPYLAWDSALGDRTVLFTEFCWDGYNTTAALRATDVHYVTSYGTDHYYLKLTSAGVVIPSVVIDHGFVTTNKKEESFDYAGMLPKQVCWV